MIYCLLAEAEDADRRQAGSYELSVLMENPMKTLLLVGIDAGDPDYITYQAIKALRRSGVIFLMVKDAAKHKLNALRREICARFLDGHTPRFAEGLQPERERDAADYRASVDELNRDKQAVFEQLIDEQMAGEDGEAAAP